MKEVHEKELQAQFKLVEKLKQDQETERMMFLEAEKTRREKAEHERKTERAMLKRFQEQEQKRIQSLIEKEIELEYQLRNEKEQREKDIKMLQETQAKLIREKEEEKKKLKEEFLRQLDMERKRIEEANKELEEMKKMNDRLKANRSISVLFKDLYDDDLSFNDEFSSVEKQTDHFADTFFDPNGRSAEKDPAMRPSELQNITISKQPESKNYKKSPDFSHITGEKLSRNTRAKESFHTVERMSSSQIEPHVSDDDPVNTSRMLNGEFEEVIDEAHVILERESDSGSVIVKEEEEIGLDEPHFATFDQAPELVGLNT